MLGPAGAEGLEAPQRLWAWSGTALDFLLSQRRDGPRHAQRTYGTVLAT